MKSMRPYKNSQLSPFSQLLLKLSLLGVTSLYLVDLFTYSGFVKNHLFFHPLTFTFCVALIHLFFKRSAKISLPHSFSQASLAFLFPMSLILYAVILISENAGFLYPNFFFANFRIHYPILLYAAIHFLIFGLVHLEPKAFRKIAQAARQHKPALIFYFLPILLISILLIYLDEPLVFYKLITEDGVIEMLTFGGYLWAGFLALKISRRQLSIESPSRYHRFLRVTFILTALISFLIAGEEISWGQRLLKIETPARIAERNLQAEINLHNNESVWPYVYKAYALLGLYGSFSWLFYWLTESWFESKPSLRYLVHHFIVPPYVALYFFLIVIYVWLRRLHGPWQFQRLEEISELVLTLGIVFFFYHVLEKIKSTQNS